MDLMTLAAKLTLDDSGFRSGISNAESAGQNLTGKISSMTVAVGNIMSDVIKKGFSTVKEMVGGAVNAYADYQQLIGGVETLFKTDADKVSAYAKDAYRTAGISANNYMETVTSFSASLLQGLKGDTEQAAEISNMAITDMADNANKMGTDMTSIQNAYQGFAKQNFTLLDNLKLGYGGTKGEMLRLVNESGIMKEKVESLDDVSFDQIIQAIHAIQEQMGITGTTAEEADKTISGSAASMKAAWEDLLSAIGGEGGQANLDAAMEKFKSSFGTYMENFIPTLTTTIANSGSLVEAVAGAITSIPKDTVSKLLSSGLEAGTGIIDGAGNIATWLIDSIIKSLSDVTIDPSKVVAFGKALGTFAGESVSKILTNLGPIAEGLRTVGVTLAGSIIQGIWDGLFGNKTEIKLEKINEELAKTISESEIQSSKAQAILKYMEELHRKYGEAARTTEEWKNAEGNLEEVLGGSKGVFEEYGSNVQGAIQKLKDMADELRKLAIQQAMQDKLNAQLKLLGEEEFNKAEAEATIEYAKGEMEELDKRRAESAKAYAEELKKRNYLEQGSSDWWLMKNTLETPGYAGTAVEQLASLIEDMYEWNNTKEDEKVWNKDEFDDVFSPEVLGKLGDEYEANRKAVEDAKKTIAESDENIKKINTQIGITQTAMDRMSTQLQSAGEAAAYASSTLRSIQKPSWASKVTGETKEMPSIINPNFGNYGPSIYPGMPLPEAGKATGMDYVPYDGYRAVLHKGEAIITREENSRRNGRGGLGDDVFAAIDETEDRLIQALNNVYFNVDGQKIASLTTAGVHRGISTNEHARIRAMGG